jgi:hypothetical protein
MLRKVAPALVAIPLAVLILMNARGQDEHANQDAALSAVMAAGTPSPDGRSHDSATPSSGNATPVVPELPQLGIQPVDVNGSYFNLQLKPGEQRNLTVALGNFGKQPQRVLTYAADVHTLINGGFDPALAGAPASGTTTWLDYKVETLMVDAGQSVERTFTVKVPDDTGPGEYVTSLVIQNADPVKGTGGVAINQVLRQAIAVAITVPGERKPGLEIGDASYRNLPASSSLRVALTNAGNVLLKPTGELVLTDTTGKEVLRVPVVMDSVYAGTDTLFEVPLPTPLNPGDYVVSLTLADKDHDLSSQEETRQLTVSVGAATPAVATEIASPLASPLASPIAGVTAPATPSSNPTIPATPAAAIATAATTAPQASTPIQPGEIVVTNDDVKLRAAPDATALAVASLAAGTELQVIGPAKEGAGFTWWPVSDPKTGTIGYVRAEFLSPKT